LPDFRLKLEKLLNRNRLFKGSLIHLLITPIYPNTGVDPGPGFTCMGLTEEIEFDYFPLNQKGLSIGVSERYHNTTDPYVSSMIRSPLRSIMIRQESDTNGWDEIILTDPDGFLSEVSDSNIFLKIKNELVTPSPATYCFPRILTGVVKGLIPLTGLTFLERPNILPDELLLADEVFLTDDRNGIRWVLGYGNKRYFRKISTLLEEELTQLIRSTDQFQAGSSG
jgi:branched-chain amino acid aminotransferase